MKAILASTALAVILGACSAGKSTDLAKVNAGQQFAATTLGAEFEQVDAPYIGVLHIPIGVTADAQYLYSDTFVDWLTADGTDDSDPRLAEAHRAFMASNGLTAPLRSGLDLGILMGSDDDFLIAHYVIAERDGKLVRDYLDDPDDFPPSLVHVDLQLHTEPRDPLLYTGDGDVLTLGSVGAPTVALAYSPDLSDIFVTSDELEGSTFLDLMQRGSGGTGPAELPTDMISFGENPATLADTRLYVRGVILDGIARFAQPSRMLDDDAGWFAFYGLQPGSVDTDSVAGVEQEVIVARNEGLRRIIEAQAGDGMRALRTAEAATYDKRREIALQQSQAEFQMAVGVFTAVMGAAAGTMAASAGDTATVTEAEALMTQASGMIEGAQIELTALSTAATDVAEAFGGFFENSIERDVGGVVETEFGRLDAGAGLASIKPDIRDALAGEG